MRTWPVVAAMLVTLARSATWAAEEQPVSFQKDIVPVLVKRCTSCHLTGDEAGNLAFNPPTAFASIVNRPSGEVPKMKLVKPGSPEESYFLLKIQGKHFDKGGFGSRMPFGSMPLDQAMEDRIAQWIRSGAPNN